MYFIQHCLIYRLSDYTVSEDIGIDPHCKDKTPKFRNKYSQKRNIGVSISISTFMRLWAIYIFPRSVSLFCWRKYVDRSSWDYVNHSQTHECWNWGWGRAIPRKGIHKGNFLCSAGLLRLWHWHSEALTTWRDLIPLTTKHRSNPVPFHVPFPLYRVMVCALLKFCSNKVAYICTVQ